MNVCGWVAGWIGIRMQGLGFSCYLGRDCRSLAFRVGFRPLVSLEHLLLGCEARTMASSARSNLPAAHAVAATFAGTARRVPRCHTIQFRPSAFVARGFSRNFRMQRLLRV